MKSTIENLGPTRVRLAIEVPWSDLDHAFGEVYKELGKQVRVPGFRPGKVPNRVLDQRIGRPVVLEQVVQHAVPEVYSEAIRENQVRVISQPDVEVTRLDDGEALAFTAEVDVAPTLELPPLDSLAVTVDDVEVTDEEIDQQVTMMRERFSTLSGVERAAEDGDFVSIDLEATLNGEVLEDGSTTGMSYEVGSGNLMQGLDEAVRGLSADESATFSTALLAGDQAGEMADVTVTVRSVKAKELPELDDEFASVASEFDTLAELREDVRTRLARTKVLQQGGQARDKLVEHLLETIEVPVPEKLVEQELSWRTQAMERELQQAGMDWDAYFSMAEVESREAYDAEMRENVEKAVKTQFVLDSIADAREVTVDNEDLSAQIMAQAQRNRVSPEQYAQQLQQGNNIAEFVADVRRTKALAQLLEETTITDESGNVVDLEALRPRTVAADSADAEDDAAEAAEDDAAEAAEAEAVESDAVEETDTEETAGKA
ncbi:trigger factor [Modestobacter sp. VKM Ac-2979]|uniref:trigger factor n=1 Tax=unclassified Modestobacter TaxID=2643866 RepID=UPI0022AB6EF2|nr:MULTISPECIES: trigger factor [unclassified Modestobacter]MCZ2809872.1 trigger factor [Modestobacter sp. VKM Ac-2979]MCZ2842713.1 trigger factor [Modestobacter sp. VKM Ac-2980]